MANGCCVTNCHSRSHDRRGKRILPAVRFFRFPTWKKGYGTQVAELTKRRRKAWVAAVKRPSITFDCISSAMFVCSRHFHSGKPAYEFMESDPDWVPSLHLGHSEVQGTTERLVNRRKGQTAARREVTTSAASHKPPSKRKTQTPTKAKQSQPLDLSRKAEFSLLSHLSKPLPESNETSREAEEIQPLDLSMKAVKNSPLDPFPHLPESKPQPNDDHSYALPSSPTLIKARLSDALNRVEILEQEKLNAKVREQSAKKYIESLLDDLKRKNLTNT